MSITELRKDGMPKRILDLQTEFIQDTALNDINLKEKTLATPGIKAKWNLCHKAELNYLSKLETLKEKLISDYTRNFGQPGVPKLVTDREALSDENIKKTEEAIKQQKEIIRFLDGIMDIMRSFGYDIKNCVDLVKMENS